MLNHPFTETILRKSAGITCLILFWLVQWGVLVAYGKMSPLNAVADSVVYVGIWALAGFLSWYTIDYLRVWQAEIVLALLVQVLCLGNCCIFLIFTGLEDSYLFMEVLPLRFVIGIAGWIILSQWYKILQLETIPLIKKELIDNERSTEEEPIEVIDRVSVKDGARIHIIHLDELFYIQASGDYVTFFTSSGQYVKEQTMKYFEQHLPVSLFVRIHRSCIVNTEQIMRVELFGKENYQIKLKNGVVLRASSAGYKLLKERLFL